MITLGDLVSLNKVDEFRRSSWTMHPAAFDSEVTALAKLERVWPLSSDPHRLLEEYPNRVSILRTDGFYANVDRGRAAIPFFEAEYTCFLRGVDRVYGELDESAESLAVGLGMHRSDLKFDVFMSSGNGDDPKPHSGLALHCDAEESLAFLVRGRKRWTIARNNYIRNPTTSVVRSGDRIVDPAQHALAGGAPPPRALEEKETVTFDLCGGQTLHVPRGWWHATEAYGECFQLNVSVTGPSWRDLLLEALGDDLILRPQWREFAYGLAGSGTERSQAASEVSKMLTELLANLDVDDLVDQIVHKSSE